jgi:hypothetical protein
MRRIALLVRMSERTTCIFALKFSGGRYPGVKKGPVGPLVHMGNCVRFAVLKISGGAHPVVMRAGCGLRVPC